MKIFRSLVFVALGYAPVLVQATSLLPGEIFEKWAKIQYIVQDHDLVDLVPSLDDAYLARFKKNYEANLPLLRTLQPLLSKITDGAINEKGYLFQPPMSDGMRSNIATLLEMLDQNPVELVAYLQAFNFKDISETTDKSQNFNFTVEKYKAFVRLLLSTKTPRMDEEFGIALANRLTEMCYELETFPAYQATMQHAEHHSIARMLHTIIWYNIIGTGWKLWHADCLRAIKDAAAAGKRIKYLAGGNDVYTLLCQGVYDITVIDPFLPSQARYYANGWEWLLSGAINDEIVGPFGDQELKLVRTKQVEGEPFIAKSGGQFVSLKRFTTTWTVYNAVTDKELGTIVFERRFTQQGDLVPDDACVFLMSYDEFIYLGLPSLLDGWGITPNSIDPNFTCHIKQLRKPVDRDFLNNLRIASITNYADLKFINLASDPN